MIKKSRRYNTFNENFERCKTTSQTGTEKDYNIDFCKDVYTNEGYTNEINVFWITYKI